MRGRGGQVLAFVIGLVVATAGTATAAKLITGKQIKDGTISRSDLTKALQQQLAKTGAAGAAGPAGAQGPAGVPGAPGTPGAAGKAGADGSAVAYATVATGGTLVPGRGAKLIADANVFKSGSFVALYCFSGLPITVNAVNVTMTSGGAAVNGQVGYDTGGCPSGTQFFVRTTNSSGVLTDGSFTVVVN